MTGWRLGWFVAVLAVLVTACAGSGEPQPAATTASPTTAATTTSQTKAPATPAAQPVTIAITTSSDWTSVMLASPHTWRQTGEAIETGSPDWWLGDNEIGINQPLEDANDGMTVVVAVPIELTGLDADPTVVLELRRGDLGTAQITLEMNGATHELDDPGGHIEDRIQFEIATGPPAPSDAGPDWIFHNGTVITITEGRAEAVAVADGRIEAVGSEDDIVALAGSTTRMIDLDGAALLPGFVDAHSHAFQNDGETVQELILAGGVTTVTEMTTTPETLDLLYSLDHDGKLRVRVSAYLRHTSVCGDVQDDWWREHLDNATENVSGDMLQLAGVKIFTDGGACNGVARSFPVTAGLDNGPLYFDDATLLQIVGDLDASGYTAGIHALGDVAVRQVLDVYEQVIDGNGNPRRHRIEHNALVHPDDRNRYDSAGMVATIFGAIPACQFQENLVNGVNTPAEYMDYEWPYAELIAGNPDTVFAWHVDYPYFYNWDAPTHLLGFTTKAERTADGTWCYTPEGMQGGIGVGEALEIMTMGSAYALGRDDEIGSIEVGKYADLVVLSQDPTAVDPYLLADFNVLLTMVGGVAEYCNPDFATPCSGP